VELQLRLSRQLHVLHAEADLGGHALDEPHLRLAELAPGLPPDQEDRPDRLTPHGGGSEEDGVGADVLEHLAVEAWVRQGVRGPDGPPLAPCLGQGRKAREDEGPGQEMLEQVLGHVVTRGGHERVALGIEAVDPDHVGPEGVGHLARHRAHEVVGRFRLREGTADGQQGRRLP
jgi:hypothetical protein